MSEIKKQYRGQLNRRQIIKNTKKNPKKKKDIKRRKYHKKIRQTS